MGERCEHRERRAVVRLARDPRHGDRGTIRTDPIDACFDALKRGSSDPFPALGPEGVSAPAGVIEDLAEAAAERRLLEWFLLEKERPAPARGASPSSSQRRSPRPLPRSWIVSGDRDRERSRGRARSRKSHASVFGFEIDAEGGVHRSRRALRSARLGPTARLLNAATRSPDACS
jgi:hypothetical protein